MEARSREPYPTDVTDEEWALVAPYLALLPEDAGQRRYESREVFNALRWIVRAGAPWRLLPHELPPWPVVYQQRAILRLVDGRAPQPTAVVLDGRTLQSTPESGHRAGYDGHKKKRGSKTHVAVDTLGYLLALVVTPANEQKRAQVATLAQEVQEATGDSVELA